MKITVRMIGLNMSPVPKSVDLVLESGVTVRQALQAVVNETGQDLSLERLVNSVLLVENKRVQAEYVLAENDTLTVLRTLEGG